ncbi:Acid phosphatase pho1 [Ancistrocladus abbreviatus]
MVKFSKELEAQLIPEWKEVFVNYRQLKKQIKRVKLCRLSNNKCSDHDTPFSEFGFSIFDPVRSLLRRISPKCSGDCGGDNDNDSVQGKRKAAQGEEEESEEAHETELVQLFSEEDEVSKFFEMLDEELDKVNGFYTIKEREFIERGGALKKQLRMLLDLKQLLENRRGCTFSKRSNVTSPCLSNLSSTRNSDYSAGNTCDVGEAVETLQTDEVMAALEKHGLSFVGTAVTRSKSVKKGKLKPALRIDIPATAPVRTISAAMSGLWEDIINSPNKKDGAGDILVNRKKMQCAEKMIRGAFVEFHRGLGLLKTYRSLNMLAFTKILKKFDKVANRQSTEYLNRVKVTHFISSDMAVRLTDDVESLFTKHFTDNDKKKAMKFLRPNQQKDTHMTTFFVGLFTGCFISMFIVYAMLAHMSGMFSRGSPPTYMETVYPIFSMFALLSLHLFMYGCNLFMWKTTRVNYNFIFEFSTKTALKSRDAFLICTSLMTTVIGTMIIHLIFKASGVPPSQVDALPGLLLLIFIALLICPLNILYRPTRYFFLRVIRNIVFSPFYKVVMVDFFMADQLTSQIPLLRHMETTACFFIARNFETHHFDTCKSGKLYRQLAYVISFAPYYWRAMQCARRWFDESDPNHLANLGKYVSALVAAGARLTYAQQPSHLWMILVLVTSVVATIYQLYWDFVMDWGFLNPNSENLWLRDDLILKNKCIYYISIVVNVVLRVAWVETIMKFNVGMFESRLLDFSLASLEVIRRGHWNFYRLENEHLNNVGKFRAVNTVPLPFREIGLDDS